MQAYPETAMTTLHSILVNIHIAAGAVALPLFWLPALAKKGSPLHVRAGKVYVITMYVVSITAFVASIMVLMDPIGIRRPGETPDPGTAARLAATFRMFSLFLLMLSVLIFASLRHGIAALRARRAPGLLARGSHRAVLAALGVLGIAVAAIGLAERQVLLIVFGLISLSGAVTMIRDTLATGPEARTMVVAHLNALIGTGIGAYTAFFAFGGARLLRDVLPGQWQVIPWILPAIVGTIAINRLRRPWDARRTPVGDRAPGRGAA